MIFAIFADKKIHNSLTKFNKHGPAMLPTKKRFTRKIFQQKEVATAIFRPDVSLCIHCFQNIDENIVKCETTGPLKYTTY